MSKNKNTENMNGCIDWPTPMNGSFEEPYHLRDYYQCQSEHTNPDRQNSDLRNNRTQCTEIVSDFIIASNSTNEPLCVNIDFIQFKLHGKLSTFSSSLLVE